MHDDCPACQPSEGELTHDRVQRALEEVNGNVTAAAELLNRDRTTVHRFIRQHRIPRIRREAPLTTASR